MSKKLATRKREERAVDRLEQGDRHEGVVEQQKRMQ